MREITIIGLGYIGLPTAAMFATHGIKVMGVEVKKEICDNLNKGILHIQEPYLSDLVQQALLNGMLRCSTDIVPTDTYVIAVPTPITEENKADMSFVRASVEKLSQVIKKGDMIIVESTVPPGTTINLIKPILERTGLIAGVDFHLAYCPERVMLGQVIYELENNNRIIGGINSETGQRAKELYSTFVKGEIHLTDIKTAELCKLVENTYRDVNIALANQLALICEQLGCNAWDVIHYANKHPRVNLHLPGPGVGGHCLAVDPWFIVEAAPQAHNIIELARKINDSMPLHICNKIKSISDKDDEIVILGCTYKADVDDIRESPILKLAEYLKHKYKVVIHDPYIDRFQGDLYKMINNADIVVLGVNHKQYGKIDWNRIADERGGKSLKIVDTRNFLDREYLIKLDFEIYSVGVGCV